MTILPIFRLATFMPARVRAEVRKTVGFVLEVKWLVRAFAT